MATKKKKVPDHEAVTPVDVFGYQTEAVDKGYTPEGFDSVEEFLQDMREEYQHDLDYDDDNRKKAIEDKQFSAGDQWDPIVLQQRKGLPCLVINSIPQFTAQLVGDWRENKKGVKVVPAENGDENMADVREDLIRAIENNSRADRVYDSAFESSVQCGDGAFRISVEYAKEDVFDQEIYVRPIDDALSVVWDRLSVDPTGRDARHVFVDDLVPLKDFEKKWPEAKPSTLSARTYTTMEGEGWIENEGVKVTEYWRLIDRNKLLGLFQDGSIRFIDDNIEDLTAKHGQVVRSRMSPVTFAQMHLVTGYDILSGPYEYRLNRVPVIRMTGRVVNIVGRRVRYGLVRFMKDAARLRNFWRSVHAEQLGYAPKAQWLAAESAVEGREDDFRKAHLTRDPLLIYNDGAEPPQRIEPAGTQIGLENAAAINAQDMKDVTGIHDASLGANGNETSGKAINARQREGDIAALTYHDNGNASLLEGGDVINQLISQIYDGTRIIRIIGDDEKVKFLKINDPTDPKSPDLSVGKYDVALTTGASYTTRRVEAAQAMMDAVQVFPQLMQVAGDLVAKAQNWPGADELAERLQKTIPQQFLDPSERTEGDPALMQSQAELQQLQQKIQSMEQDRSLQIKKLEIDTFNAETMRIKALSDNMVDGTQMEQDAIRTILEHSTDMADMNHQQMMDHKKHDLAAQGQESQNENAKLQLQQKAQAPVGAANG